jgi:sarcosine oxidase gamma subunit
VLVVSALSALTADDSTTMRAMMGELASVAEAFVSDGWPAEVAGDALTAEYSAPSAGPAPWYVYRVEPSTVFALGMSEPFGATKFRLG